MIQSCVWRQRQTFDSKRSYPASVDVRLCVLSAVVCAGIKSVLDIPRTLEYLETQGVCVAAYRTGVHTSACCVVMQLQSPNKQFVLCSHHIKAVKHITVIPQLSHLKVTQSCNHSFIADEFPAFFTPHSGCEATCRIEQPSEAAAMLQHCRSLDLQSGILIGTQLQPHRLTVCRPLAKLTTPRHQVTLACPCYALLPLCVAPL